MHAGQAEVTEGQNLVTTRTNLNQPDPNTFRGKIGKHKDKTKGVAMPDSKQSAPSKGKAAPDEFKGWLFKWTNYLKGYQRRWFVLSNGLLSYYRMTQVFDLTAGYPGQLGDGGKSSSDPPLKDRTIGSEVVVTTIRGLPSCDYFDRL
ncbi:hypothetical protein Bbelb_277070 [Branchiostoma belcheri]|nr:hypothetical protein Bbelb_277070 [Branchiostoma belcheri]